LEPSRKNNENKNVWRQVSRYTTLAMLLPTSIFVGYAIGYLLDKSFGTTWLKILFLLLGIAAGFVELIRQVQKDIRD